MIGLPSPARIALPPPSLLIERALGAQRGHLFPWIPVFLGIGIAGWFALRREPGGAAYAAAGLGCAALLLLAWRLPAAVRPLALALALVLAGALLAGHRAHSVAGPVLGWRYYGPVEGTVVAVDRSGSDKPRLTLAEVVLRDVSPERTPHRVRMSLHGEGMGAEPVPGLRVMTTGHLSPPGGPVEPGGFDFARHSWFEGLGAVGYTRVPLLVAAPAEGGPSLLVTRARMRLSAAMQAALPGETGAFAAAVTTGDRSGMSPETIESLRDSNLAHLLAISGLHMGLLTGFVFAALRCGLALVPPLALRLPAKKIAAALALVVATIYLALSGGAVATERAYVMVVVMLVAVMLDRRAISMRSVALAAIVVLVLRPETLTGPGFQMSFAATLALVAVFGAMRRAPGSRRRRLPGWARPAAGVLLSSFVAGMATAPIAAAHFNQMAHYGLIANLLSVPVMGSVVIPAAVFAALLWPVGLAALPLWAMGLGIDWILLVAHHVSATAGAVTLVPSPPAAFLPILVAGAVFAALWRGPWRLLGAAPAALALLLWIGAERPAGLISESGGLVGWMTEDGRALSRMRGDGFVGRVWLENDGDAAAREVAAARVGGSEGWTRVALPDGRVLHHLHGKSGPDRAGPLCRDDAILVLSERWEGQGRCTVLDADALQEGGAVAILAEGGAIHLLSARDRAGRRLWNDEDVRRERSAGMMAAFSDPRLSSCGSAPPGGPAPAPGRRDRPASRRPRWRPPARPGRRGGAGASGSPPARPRAPPRCRRRWPRPSRGSPPRRRR